MAGNTVVEKVVFSVVVAYLLSFYVWLGVRDQSFPPQPDIDYPPEANLTRPWEYDSDVARLTLNSVSSKDLHVYSSRIDCLRCIPRLQWDIAANMRNTVVEYNCARKFVFYVFDHDPADNWSSSLANYTFACGDRGVYNITFQEDGTLEMQTLLEPLSWWLPLVVNGALVIVLGIVGGLIARCVRCYRGKKCCCQRKKNLDEELDEEAPLINDVREEVKEEKKDETAPKKGPRIVSVDVFRGFTLCLMVFVNNGGGGYWFLEHAIWNGLYVADLVLPFFIWISGFSVSLSLKNLQNRKVSKFQFFTKAFWRFVELVLVAWMLGSTNGFAKHRAWGVLQRIAVSNFCVILIAAFMPKLCTKKKIGEDDSAFRDIKPFIFEFIFALALGLLHMFGLLFMQAPGCPRGYIGPGGIGDWGVAYNCTGGIAAWIDNQILTQDHIRYCSAKGLYELNLNFDPEGSWGCLTSIFLCYLGLQAGRILTFFQTHKQRLVRWSIWGVVELLAGLCLCGFRINDGPVPINKTLNSLSFVLVTGGIANLFFALCYVTADIWKVLNGHPLKVVGMNSIALYVASGIFYVKYPFIWNVPLKWHMWTVFRDLSTVGAYVGLAYLMYMSKIFISLG